MAASGLLNDKVVRDDHRVAPAMAPVPAPVSWRFTRSEPCLGNTSTSTFYALDNGYVPSTGLRGVSLHDWRCDDRGTVTSVRPVAGGAAGLAEVQRCACLFEQPRRWTWLHHLQRMVEHERAGKLGLFRMDAGLASDRNRLSAHAAMAHRANLGAWVCTWSTTLGPYMTTAFKTNELVATGHCMRPAASWGTLAVIGSLAVIMGVSFVVLRPIIVLLPEDQRFTGLTPDQLKAINAQLFVWIGFVFRSWGAFAIGLGILITAIAMTAYRQGERWAWWALAVAGLTTFGIFLSVNLMLGSDFGVPIALLLAAYVWALWYGRSCVVPNDRRV